MKPERWEPSIIILCIIFGGSNQLRGAAEPAAKKTTVALIKQGEKIYHDFIATRDAARQYFQDRRFIVIYDAQIRGIWSNFCRVGAEMRRSCSGPYAYRKNLAVIACLEQFIEQLLDVKNAFMKEIGVRKQYLWEQQSEPQLVLGGSLATANCEISIASVRSPCSEHWVAIEDESGFGKPRKPADKKSDQQIFYLEIRELENNSELYKKNLSRDRNRLSRILLPQRAIKIAIERYICRIGNTREWWQSTLKAVYLFAYEANVLSKIIIKVCGFRTDFRFYNDKNEELFVDTQKSF